MLYTGWLDSSSPSRSISLLRVLLFCFTSMQHWLALFVFQILLGFIQTAANSCACRFCLFPMHAYIAAAVSGPTTTTSTATAGEEIRTVQECNLIFSNDLITISSGEFASLSSGSVVRWNVKTADIWLLLPLSLLQFVVCENPGLPNNDNEVIRLLRATATTHCVFVWSLGYLILDRLAPNWVGGEAH